MPIIKYAVCDNCGVQAPLNEAIDGDPFVEYQKWFMVNISHVYCSEICWHEHDQHEDKER
jgi:hypothetical protein